MRAWLVVLALSTTVDAEPIAPARWQQATNAPAMTRVWGVGAELYGVGASGVFRSLDAGASWASADKGGAANAVWGTGLDDIWVVRDRSIHHSVDGAGGFWSAQTLPVSMSTKLEGIWGSGNDRYVFGSDRALRSAVLVHSRDRGASWRSEDLDGERIAGMWGRTADVYAVGSRGVLHSTGDGWSVVARGSFEAIWGDAKTIYAVGANGAIVSSTDGTTWTRRTSGVSYTLSSIIGSNGELYAGSLDGAPLRSTDGITWKPVTAMISKGHVWTSGESLVVASSQVHYFGDDKAPVYGWVIPDLRALAARYATYPALREFLEDASHRLDPHYGAAARTPQPLPPGVTLESRLAQALAAAPDADAELEAHARYVLDGGTRATSALEISKRLDLPISWKGFAWSAAYTPPPSQLTQPAQVSVNCAPAIVAREESDGDEASRIGLFFDALSHYQRVVPCKPSALSKAYLAACRSHTFGAAKAYYDQINKPSLAQICLKEGFDPQAPAARSAPPASGH